MYKIKRQDKDRINCFASISVILACYACERLLEAFTVLSSQATLLLTLAFMLCLAAVFYLLSKTRNAFLGLLAALIGYKMMPPSIPSLENASVDGNMIYYIVQKIAVIGFILLAIKLYRLQKKPAPIKALPLIACMIVVPFVTQIGADIGSYLMYQISPSMLFMYFSQFAAYLAASAVILVIAYRYNYETMRFVAYYEFLALGINILRRLGSIASLLIRHSHVSKSYYVWLLVYAVCILAFWIAKNTKKKEA